MAKPTAAKPVAAKTPLVKTALARRLDEIAAQYGDKRQDGKVAVENCIAEIRESGKTEPLSEDLRADCKAIMAVVSDYDVPVSLSEVQTMWRRYSERHGVEWVSPKDTGEIERGLYVVATMPWRKGGDDGTENRAV